MKIIKDIRFYKSEQQNEYGKPITCSFADKKLNVKARRIVMKLRECEFSLGEFDHLYVNFTICDMDAPISLSNEVDRYHPWYRYCSVKVSNDFYNRLGDSETYDDIIDMLDNILVTYFATENFDGMLIHSCIRQAVEQGENMLMKFKEKVTTKRKAIIFLRYLDTCKFFPLLRVYDPEDNLLFETDLPETSTLDYFGDIQISTTKVTIKPRKNAFTADLQSMVIEYDISEVNGLK